MRIVIETAPVTGRHLVSCLPIQVLWKVERTNNAQWFLPIFENAITKEVGIVPIVIVIVTTLVGRIITGLFRRVKSEVIMIITLMRGRGGGRSRNHRVEVNNSKCGSHGGELIKD